MNDRFRDLNSVEALKFLKKNNVIYNWKFLKNCNDKDVNILIKNFRYILISTKSPPIFLNEIQLDWIVDQFLLHFKDIFLPNGETISEKEIDEMFSKL